MKKIVAALLVLTMVLALTGTAMAGCKFAIGDCVKFTKNTVAYDNHRDSADTSTIVEKGSIARVVDTFGSNWVKLQLNITDASKTGWFKVANLKCGKPIVTVFGTMDIFVIYCNGGVKGSSATGVVFDDIGGWLKDGNGTRISADCIKHVKATAKVWMHKEPSLKKNYGKALRKDDVVKYRRVWAFDDRGVGFYGIRYSGKCLWVSEAYTKLVK